MLTKFLSNNAWIQKNHEDGSQVTEIWGMLVQTELQASGEPVPETRFLDSGPGLSAVGAVLLGKSEGSLLGPGWLRVWVYCGICRCLGSWWQGLPLGRGRV